MEGISADIVIHGARSIKLRTCEERFFVFHQSTGVVELSTGYCMVANAHLVEWAAQDLDSAIAKVVAHRKVELMGRRWSPMQLRDAVFAAYIEADEDTRTAYMDKVAAMVDDYQAQSLPETA